MSTQIAPHIIESDTNAQGEHGYVVRYRATVTEQFETRAEAEAYVARKTA